MKYKICAIIATYNHHAVIEATIAKLQAHNIAVFVVDDASNNETQTALAAIYHKHPAVSHIRLPLNQGKGGAVMAGLNLAVATDYTHALQIDADGQHCLDKLENFLQLSVDNPHCFISGHPVYDETVPMGRKIGRLFTTLWVWIETLSLRISDSMCGMRIYPLAPTMKIIQNSKLGKRMDFDIEIMVRLFWSGVPVLMTPVKVIYPAGNTSNFAIWRDNVRISKLHTKLFFSMLFNLPSIIQNRPDYSKINQMATSLHWTTLNERGTTLGLLTLLNCYRLLGRHLVMAIGSVVLVYFYATAKQQRTASKDFLQRVNKFQGITKTPSLLQGFRHFHAFLQMMVDKLAAWSGRMNKAHINQDAIDTIEQIFSQPRGGILLVSHLGNMEFCRAISTKFHQKPMQVLLHTRNSQRYSAILQAINPDYGLNIIEVSEVGPETILWLQQQIATGHWVVIAGDRIPIHDNKRTSTVSFLGADAQFSQGPYILASLLECPVYTAMAVRVGAKYKVAIEQFSERITLTRTTREQSLRALAQKYAHHLETYCVQYPYQWFNFFKFWNAA